MNINLIKNRDKKESSLSVWFPYLIGLCLGLCFFVFNTLGINLKYYPGDLGDARFNMYILEHAHKFFIGIEPNLWNAGFMFPEKNIITYSDNLIGTAPIYSVFRLFGNSRETAFQLWFIALCVLNYSSSFLFLKKVFNNSYAAALGAFVFAFSISLQSQLSHAQTYPRFAIPICFLMIYQFTKGLDAKYFFLGLLALVYQFYCCIYLGFLLFFPVLVLLIVIFIFHVISKNENFIRPSWYGLMAISLAINMLLLIPLMWPYYLRSKLVGLNLFSGIVESIPTFKSHIFSPNGSLCWNFLDCWQQDFPAYWDHQIFPGLIGIVSIFLFFGFGINQFLRDKNKKESIFYYSLLFSALFTFLFFIRIDKASLYFFIFKLPGFASLRSLTRIVNVELIFYSIAVCSLFIYLENKKWTKSKALLSIFFLFLIADNYVNPEFTNRKEKVSSQNRITLLKEKMKFIKPGSIVSYEPLQLNSSFVDYQLDAMLASQSLNLKCINAYTATAPPAFGGFWFNLDSTSRKQWLKEMHYHGKVVVIN